MVRLVGVFAVYGGGILPSIGCKRMGRIPSCDDVSVWGAKTLRFLSIVDARRPHIVGYRAKRGSGRHFASTLLLARLEAFNGILGFKLGYYDGMEVTLQAMPML